LTDHATIGQGIIQNTSMIKYETNGSQVYKLFW